MKKLINGLITEMKNLSSSIRNIEQKLEIIEKELSLDADIKVVTVEFNDSDIIDHSLTTVSSDTFNEWEQIKSVLRGQFQDISYKTWIEPITVIKLDEMDITLSVPSEFHKTILKERYINYIKNAISSVTGREYNIEINVFRIPENKIEIDSVGIGKQNKVTPSNFNSKYLFEDVVVGNNNELAYKSALKVAKSPGEDMKLLYIYGGVGMGKTHLLNSIANYIIENNKSIKVTNITINNFVNELINSISNNTKNLFNSKFYDSDVLIFDDLQNINGKERTQDEFRNIVNTALDMGKQVVLGSSKPSNEITINGEKFESVFEINAVFEVTKLDVNTRIQILKKMVSKERNLNIDDDTINIIAENIDTNVRELKGAYNKIVSYIKMVDKKIDREIILSVIKGDRK